MDAYFEFRPCLRSMIPPLLSMPVTVVYFGMNQPKLYPVCILSHSLAHLIGIKTSEVKRPLYVLNWDLD